MSIYDSPLWWKSVDREIAAFGDMGHFDGMSVMVTGAAGLVCSALVDMLIRHNETSDGKVTIYAAGRWFEEMESRFDEYARRDYFRFVEYDASKSDNKIIVDADYIVHGASNAHPLAIANEPVETMLSNFIGVQQLLEQSRRGGRNSRLLYISSSEVYGKVGGVHALEETEYGYVDLMNPRNSYSVGKRAAETLCVSYAAEYGVDCVIARPGHIYGPTASCNDNRVASAWARAAACGENIVMKSDGRQLRSWCHCLDCASALLAIMLKGERGSAYNISNPLSVGSIADLAECVAKVGGVDVVRAVASDTERRGFNPMENSSLDGSRLQNLGWRGIFDLEQGTENTVAILRDTIDTVVI